MMEGLKGTNGKILLAALAGTTAGIIAGLLMAPQTGQEVRRGISRRAFNAGDLVNNAFRKYTGLVKIKKNGKGKKKKQNFGNAADA